MENRYPQIGGFYYHYKHDPNGPINHHAYEIVNIGHHTEIEGLKESEMVVYQPLYSQAGVYTEGKHFDLRPREMFMEEVTKDGKTFPRFTLITDPQVIEELKKIKSELY